MSWTKNHGNIQNQIAHCYMSASYVAVCPINSCTSTGFELPPKGPMKNTDVVSLTDPRLTSIVAWVRNSMISWADDAMFSETLCRHSSKSKWMYIRWKRFVTGAMRGAPKTSSDQQEHPTSACANHVTLWQLSSWACFLEWLSPAPQILLIAFPLPKIHFPFETAKIEIWRGNKAHFHALNCNRRLFYLNHCHLYDTPIYLYWQMRNKKLYQLPEEWQENHCNQATIDDVSSSFQHYLFLLLMCPRTLKAFRLQVPVSPLLSRAATSWCANINIDEIE